MDGHADGHTDGQRENSILPTNKFCGVGVGGCRGGGGGGEGVVIPIDSWRDYLQVIDSWKHYHDSIIMAVTNMMHQYIDVSFQPYNPQDFGINMTQITLWVLSLGQIKKKYVFMGTYQKLLGRVGRHFF